MGIERIRVEGFRSLKQVDWEPANLNVLIGPNGSGKSNVLDAIKLLSAAASGSFEDLVSEWGGIRSLSWGYSAGPVALTVCGKFLAGLFDGSPKEEKSFTYRLVVSCSSDPGDYALAEELLTEKGGRDVFAYDLAHATKIKDALGKAVRQPRLGVHTENGEREAIRMALSGWRVYQEVPVGRNAEIRRSVQTRRVSYPMENGQDLIAVLHTNYESDRGFKEAVDDAMRAVFGDEYEELRFPPAEDTRTQLRVKWRGLELAQAAFDLSDGIIRFLFLITLLSLPRPPLVLAIDEPESGLHPSMLPIIAEYAVETSQRTQLILTTHSPEMLNAFTATRVLPKVTIAFWENCQTILKTPREDVLDHWLKSYALGELMTSGELEEIAE